MCPCVLVDVRDVVNRPADRVEEGGAAPHVVLPVGHGSDLIEGHPVVQDLALVVEEDGGDEGFLPGLFLPVHHRVEAADRVGLESSHRPRSVQNVNDFRVVCAHVSYLPFFSLVR